MSHDEELADRVRAALAGEVVTEKRMFGGLAFLIDGHLTVAVSGRGGLMVRVGPARTAALLGEPGVVPVEMGRGPVSGWVHVQPAALGDDRELNRWVGCGLAVVRALPPT